MFSNINCVPMFCLFLCMQLCIILAWVTPTFHMLCVHLHRQMWLKNAVVTVLALNSWPQISGGSQDCLLIKLYFPSSPTFLTHWSLLPDKLLPSYPRVYSHALLFRLVVWFRVSPFTCTWRPERCEWDLPEAFTILFLLHRQSLLLY